MTTNPMSLADEIAQHVSNYGGTEDEAAAVVIPRRARATERAESTDPAVLCPAIREALHLSAKIDGISRTVSTPPYYTVHTDRGPVALGPSSKWATRPSEFAACFLDSLGEMPAVPKAGEKRRDLFGMIARAAVPESIGVEATHDGWTRSMLAQYLDQRPPVDTAEEGVESEYPYREADATGQVHVYIFGATFRLWLRLTHAELITTTELGRRLRGVGCDPDSPNVVVEGKRTTRSVWQLPVDLLDAP